MNKQLEDIKVIREMMEKSTKFLSLSGLSGIIAGVIALAGAFIAYFCVIKGHQITDLNRMDTLLFLFMDAMIVLGLSIVACIYFSWRKAKKNGQKFLNNITLKTIYDLAIPLVAGGIVCLIYLFRGNTEIVISATLIFYGLALINASKYTFDEVHYLGLTEIVLGILSAIFVEYGFWIWAFGFGVCHVLYGTIMYVKYDRKK